QSLAGSPAGSRGGSGRFDQDAGARGEASRQGFDSSPESFAQGNQERSRGLPRGGKEISRCVARTNRKSRPQSPDRRRAPAEGGHLLRRSLRYLGRNDSPRTPSRPIRPSSAQKRASWPHARIH